MQSAQSLRLPVGLQLSFASNLNSKSDWMGGETWPINDCPAVGVTPVTLKHSPETQSTPLPPSGSNLMRPTHFKGTTWRTLSHPITSIQMLQIKRRYYHMKLNESWRNLWLNKQNIQLTRYLFKGQTIFSFNWLLWGNVAYCGFISGTFGFFYNPQLKTNNSLGHNCYTQIDSYSKGLQTKLLVNPSKFKVLRKFLDKYKSIIISLDNFLAGMKMKVFGIKYLVTLLIYQYYQNINKK